MKKQVSLPVRVAPAKQDLNGEKDTDPLLRNCQSFDTVDTKDRYCSKRSKKYVQPIHPIPSSLIMLNEEEKLELEAVLFDNILISIGLL
jgi:hypothetical protein